MSLETEPWFSENAVERAIRQSVKQRKGAEWTFGNISSKISGKDWFPSNEGNLNRLKMEFIDKEEHYIKFRLEGLDASMANGIRRTLLSSVPSVAIEKIDIFQNTGVIQDEVLVQRLCLIPFNIDPDEIDWRTGSTPFMDRNSFKFRLNTGVITLEDMDASLSKVIYARDFEWIPLSDAQAEKYKDNPPRPVHEDIIITRMRPGQEIELEFYLQKGIGSDHAKWNPVATASYYFDNHMEFDNEKLSLEDKEEIKELLPKGAIKIDKKTKKITQERSVSCTFSRVCVERFPGRVTMVKARESYIFQIETTGGITAIKALKKALEILKNKGKTGSEICGPASKE